MTNEDDRDDLGDLTSTVPDYTASMVRVLSGVAGPAGTLLAELVTVGIARQRQERLTEYLQSLAERTSQLEGDVESLRGRLHDPERVELFEVGALAAARASSADRRTYIAELVARGLTRDERSADEAKKLLNVLNDLTDAEVITLMHWAGSGGDGELYEKHEDILRPPRRVAGAPQGEQDRAALQEGYLRNLQRLGLMDDGTPAGSRSVTDFGRMLLRYVGVDLQSGTPRR